MIIYNITVKVEAAAANKWLKWMKEEHLNDMMNTGLFSDYRISKLMGQDEADGVTFVIQYHTDSIENYESYLAEHAQKMQQKELAKFADNMVAFRTVMEVIN